MESKFLVRMSASDVELVCRSLERALDTRDVRAETGAGRDVVEALLSRLSARRASARQLARAHRGARAVPEQAQPAPAATPRPA